MVKTLLEKKLSITQLPVPERALLHPNAALHVRSGQLYRILHMAAQDLLAPRDQSIAEILKRAREF